MRKKYSINQKHLKRTKVNTPVSITVSDIMKNHERFIFLKSVQNSISSLTLSSLICILLAQVSCNKSGALFKIGFHHTASQIKENIRL